MEYHDIGDLGRHQDRKTELTMLNDKFRLLAGMTWEEAATLSNHLFVEADKLDERAALLLRTTTAGPDVWSEFASVKRASQSIRAEAQRSWLRATLILNSIDPKAGKASNQKVH